MGDYLVTPYADVANVSKGIIGRCGSPDCSTPCEQGVTCIDCGTTRCWSCRGWSRVALCCATRCVHCSKEADPEDEECAIPGAERLDAQWQAETAQHLAAEPTQAKARAETADANWRKCRQFRAFTAAVCGRYVCPPMPSARLLVFYIMSRLDYVDAAVIANEISAIGLWCALWIAIHPACTNPRLHPDVTTALEYAKQFGFVADAQRPAAVGNDIKRFIEEYMHSREAFHRNFALGILIVSCTFMRRIAAGRLMWPGLRDAEDTSAVTTIALRESEGVKYVRIEAQDRKNTRFNATTIRYFSDSDVTGFPWLTWFLILVKDLTPGFLLRTSSGGPATDRWWTDCLDFYAKFTLCARLEIGATSFRRWFAQALTAAGIRTHQLRALDFWVSDACKIYLKEDAHARLALLGGGNNDKLAFAQAAAEPSIDEDTDPDVVPETAVPEPAAPPQRSAAITLLTVETPTTPAQASEPKAIKPQATEPLLSHQATSGALRRSANLTASAAGTPSIGGFFPAGVATLESTEMPKGTESDNTPAND